MYPHLLEEFNKTTADPRRAMQKEWDDKEAAWKNGGG
jgi:hypothetical protein